MSADKNAKKSIDDDSGETVVSQTKGLTMGLAGQSIGKYRLVEELGQGGQGYVYLAEDQLLKRRVALKILLERARMSPESRIRFEREAEAASKLDHSGIARVYEVGEEDGLAFIAFELVQGQTLQAQIRATIADAEEESNLTEVHFNFDDAEGCETVKQSSRSSRKQSADRDAIVVAARFVENAARALHAAHEAGLLHRDIKPANLMVRHDMSACILDFGLAKDEKSTDFTLTNSGDIMGTPAYMSPEQLMTDRMKLDRRTDIYSLGVTLFEACTLTRPFKGNNFQDLYRAILEQEPPNPRAINPKIPKDLASIILTSIDKSRNRRYASALDFADDLQRFLQFEPVHARPSGPAVKVLRWVQRNPLVALASCTAFLAITVAAVVFYVKNDQANEALAATSAALNDVERLADVRRLREALESEETLWPARPEQVHAIKKWLNKYEDLKNALPRHQVSLAALRRDSLPYSEARRRQDHADDFAQIEVLKELNAGDFNDLKVLKNVGLKETIRKRTAQRKADMKTLAAKVKERLSWQFGEDSIRQWKHDVLAELVNELKDFCAEETGTFAQVQQRLIEAQKIAETTITAHQELWQQTIAAIQKSAQYDGLEMKPQVGLIPLGVDPQSQLHEFLHLETHKGSIPERGEDGKIRMTDDTGIILVLIPKGKTWIGSQKDDPKLPNYDPLSHISEPYRAVSIDKPFFFSKYEMTQGQWQRSPAEIKNPSFYKVGWSIDEHKGNVTLLNPAERISWEMSSRVLKKVGLQIPDEEHWEYAARAGTSSAYVGGVNQVNELAIWGNISGQETAKLMRFHEESIRDDYVIHAPVGLFRANAFGLHDVFGNLWEFTTSRSLKSDYIIRGGSHVGGAEDARVARRSSCIKYDRLSSLGCRPFTTIAE